MSQQTMKLIAHRGNTNGPSPEFENTPEYIRKALRAGYDVETDVWCLSDLWCLGHDGAETVVSFDFLKQKGLWCHAKTPRALSLMIEKGVLCFANESDLMSLVSNGKIWSTYYQRKDIIYMEAGLKRLPEKDCYGVCSDYVSSIRKELKC